RILAGGSLLTGCILCLAGDGNRRMYPVILCEIGYNGRSTRVPSMGRALRTDSGGPLETLAVLDFETTGLSPQQGARPTEIAVVLLRDGQIVDRYQSLMNAGVRIPWDIQQLTGITNDMVRGAPRVEQVMAEAAEFVGDHPIVAHNASFRSEEHTSELQSRENLVCRLLL